MSRRRYNATVSDPFDGLVAQTQLPTDRPIAIYYRQSTEAQIGNVSTSMQTVDMVTYLLSRGWKRDDILLIDMDGGVSGTTKIDERPGMSKLFQLITTQAIGAVACQDEDRLFRDVTQIQVNIFVEACRTNKVLLLTPSMVYDFGHPQMGTFHARQFRFKSEMAAEYINAVIKGRLHTAKRRLLMEGRWAGPPMPVGYMADMRRTLPDGSRNPNWRKYEIFEPYAEVVAEYFRLFLSFAGNLRKTLRHIQSHGPYYPDPVKCQPPEGYKVVYRIRPNKHGWCPTARTTLFQMFTNAIYVGHWTVNGAVIHWNTHSAIVPEEVFYKVFNYLSPVLPDGSENESYRPSHFHARPSKEEDRTEERPLCAGIMFSLYEGAWRQVGTTWVSPLQHYSYVLWSADGHNSYVWSKRAKYVDDVISRMLLQKLTATFNFTAWEAAVESFMVEYEEKRALKRSQLTQLKTVMDNLIASLGALSNPHMIRATEERYEAAQAEYERLEREVNAQWAHKNQMDKLREMTSSCGTMVEEWPHLSMDERRVIVQSFIDRVEATPTDLHGLHVVVRWKDNSSSEVILPRRATNGVNWLSFEVDLLVKLIEARVDQIEIAKAFPERQWKSIMWKYYEVRKSPERLKFCPKPITDDETYIDYVRRVGENSGSSTTNEVHPQMAHRTHTSETEDSLAHINSVGCSETIHRDDQAIPHQDGASVLRQLNRRG